MKKTSKIALCGVLAAVELVVLLAAYFPYLTYALPALAGAFTIPVVVDVGKKHAWIMFSVVSVLSFFLCEKEAMVFYILFFGHYPIIKSYIEQIKSKPVCLLIKFICATVCFAIAYYLTTFVMGIDIETVGDFGKYTSIVFLVMYDVVFFVYDIALTRIVGLYILKFRKQVRKIFYL